MRCLLASGGLLFLRSVGMLFRRRACSGSLLVLALLCLCYQTLMVDRTRPSDEETRSFISSLEDLQGDTQVQISSQSPPQYRRAVVLTGQHPLSDTGVQLHQRVLQQMDYKVHVSRYAETSSFLKTQQGMGGWSLLLCLSSSERSCLRKINFSQLQQHQMVNLLPGLMEAFSDAGGGLCHFYIRSQLTESDLPMKLHSCGLTNHKLHFPLDSSPFQAPPPALVAMVNVYVLVTSVTPLTSFIHDISVVMTNQQLRGRSVKITDFLQQLGPTTSHHVLGQIKRVIGQVLQAALTNEKQEAVGRCVSCFQMLTFTLLFSGSSAPAVVQVDTEFTFSALRDEAFERQITKDRIMEDTLQFLLSPWAHLSSGAQREQYGGCRGTLGVCLSHDEFLLLLLFQQRLKKPSAFQLLYPSSSFSSSSSAPLSISDLLLRISCYYELQTNSRAGNTDQSTNMQPSSSQHEGVCVDPHLRQIYTDPPLILTPPFSPSVKEYHTEVTFDTVMVRIRPEPVSSTCRVHLDEQCGPRMANYPVGLGNGRISILVTGGFEQKVAVMTIYTVHVHRESRPSMPMFGDHVMCSFVQDCGLLVQPGVSCGLQPHITSQIPVQTCSSGHVPGRWVVPCLSCSDNRTCDWREVAWQADGCYHKVVPRPLLQECMSDRKVLFIGDSTNRGMMYFLMERVNSSLEDWEKAHDTLVYPYLNGGRTQVSYSYYPQFWLDRKRRPTFREALLQLLARSRPLENSNRTILVVGGVQWLNTNHLRTVQEVLDREFLGNILVVVKSLGLGFHLPVDGVRSLSLVEIQNLFKENKNVIAAAKHHGYEVIDTFSITMGRYKEFLQGRCACHFHEVEKFRSLKTSDDSQSFTKKVGPAGVRPARAGSEFQPTVLDTDQETGSSPQSYHVKGPVNQVYSEILLSRLCPKARDGGTGETHLFLDRD
ncbi:cadherin-like and PC-esterase domain-containing protein 1 isoform X2 [Melanotaenia boesemani]|uniref:cadherin-like and PC-esterase domain-containing protein 1 isoform X2 n=1 Tax=Melanotaenia boesemani TaxID=1250792 RepID=UPI001C0584A8|nr:cadherin-like and PC-esterase domain-containing protein 1 isoform X2 [Melanotaenia boesemani]